MNACPKLFIPRYLGSSSSIFVTEMNLHHTLSSPTSRRISISSPSWKRFQFHQQYITIPSNSGLSYYPQLEWHQLQRWKISEKKKKRNFFLVNLKEEETVVISKKKGTIAGAVALIIGTSIGSGILALPKKTSPAGIIPSSISMTICWAFLLLEALLLVEINVGMRRKKKLKLGDDDDDELEIISIRTMAKETLGECGGAVATAIYVFLGYSSMIAYSSKSGEILYRLINLPESISGILFTSIFTILISVGGTRATDQVNQWLTASMIGLLIAIEVLAVLFGGGSGMDGNGGHWERIPPTLPVMIFTLVYHDLAPVLCAYLEGDLTRIRASIFLGSLVPLIALLIWEVIALSLSTQSGQACDPLELLMSVRWSGVPVMVEAFSLLAVGTSLIGTLLSFSEFFKEQLANSLSFMNSSSSQVLENPNSLDYFNNWWKRNKASVTATAMVIAPSLLVSTTVTDAFSAATDIAGGYCMTMLYGVLPPAMAWAMNKKQGQETEQRAVSKAGPALVGVGLFACGIVLEQIVQDFSWLHP